MTVSWQQVLYHKYQYLACKYKYKYQYPEIVLKYRSSTSTSTQYNKTVINIQILTTKYFSFQYNVTYCSQAGVQPTEHVRQCIC